MTASLTPGDDAIAVTFTAYVPRKLLLSVQTDTRGRRWPGLGLNLTRTLHARELIEQGVEVQWADENGLTLTQEHALALIDQRQHELDNGGDAPEFDVAANSTEQPA